MYLGFNILFSYTILVILTYFPPLRCKHSHVTTNLSPIQAQRHYYELNTEAFVKSNNCYALYDYTIAKTLHYLM